jgi:NADPH-dependent glutamate synthase beta subunit-like oxidoreductase/NAD(P)H-flavin reductase
MNIDSDKKRSTAEQSKQAGSPFVRPMHARKHSPLRPGIPGFSYDDLHDPLRLPALTAAFDHELKLADAELFAKYEAHRSGATRLEGPAESELLIALASHVSRFTGQLFGVTSQLQALRDAVGRDGPIFRVKRDFVQRRVFKKGAPERPVAAEFPELQAQTSILLEAATLLDDKARDATGDEELLCALVIDAVLDGERAMAIRLDAKKPGSLDTHALHRFRSLAAALGAGLRSSHSQRAVAVRDAFPALLGEPRSNPEPDAEELLLAKSLLTHFDRFLFALTLHPDGKHRAHSWNLIRLPHTLDFANLVPLGKKHAHGTDLIVGQEHHQRRRDGFTLTDARGDLRSVLSEIDYCIYCHEREKDSCSSGFKEKTEANPKAPLTGRRVDESAPFKKNPLGIPLTGCPLEERIGEMHKVGGEGDPLGALALVAIDNPMMPGTGHRICNDCMKACVYQKQEPVNIPQIETRMLSDVLKLQWGFEIWSLLTRWNPLCIAEGKRQEARPYSGLNALVVGLGPAGYTLAHHLCNQGFGVVGVDGLKIEPIPDELLGRAPGQTAPLPIEWVHEQFGAPLDERVTSGFGGVSEYGITVRWDKSFLDILHLNLARRKNLRVYGGVRFGGTLDIDDAWKLGFDHIALAAGAGKPTIIPLKNNLIRGIRKASDFLMALQLTGSFKDEALANLQVRLPAVVIGGGLTGVDTATELAAYYPVQVEKLLARHIELSQALGEQKILSVLDVEEREVYLEFLAHGRAIAAERQRARLTGELPNLSKLVNSWGGVTLAYRKGLVDSPAYRLNHEEVAKALEEGISFAEGLSPVEAVPDARGAVASLKFAKQKLVEGKWRDAGEIIELPARTVCVAAGTAPNVTLEREAPGRIEMDPEYGSFKPYLAERQADGTIALKAASVNEDLSGEAGFFTSYNHDGKLISFFGDNHPTYAGSVVKAMASAKDGFPRIAELFAKEHAAQDESQRTNSAEWRASQASRDAKWKTFGAKLDDELLATVHQVNRLTPTIIEVIVRAPAAARKFLPGQFYRLQNFESIAPNVGGTSMLMEGLALTGAWVDAKEGLLSMIVLEMGGSSSLCALLRPGEPVVVMGPTGAPSTLPKNEDVVLCGGGLGNAVLFSIGKGLRANGCRVIYFAGYRNAQDVFKRDDIEASADVVVWAVDRLPNSPTQQVPPEPRRPGDKAFVGNMVEAMVAYASGDLGEVSVPMTNVQRMIAIGSDRMMAAVSAARHGILKPHLPPEHIAIASINSPMQCMMKEICAQCLQKHRDPKTGVETVVFTCFDQDQEMDRMDWDHLRARLRGNSLQEKLAALWVARMLEKSKLARI